MRYGDPRCAHGASTRYAPRSRIRLPLPTFGGPALRAVYSRKVCHFVLLRAHFAIPSEQLRRCARDVMAITKMRFLLIGRNKRGLLRSPWTKVLLSKEIEKCLARPPRLWPPYNRPTRCSRALVKLQSQFRLRLFGVETASPHGQAVQHETGHEVRITINRIVSTPMRTPPRVLTATSEQQNRPAM